MLPPDTQFTRIKVNKVPKEFDVFTHAVKLLASEDNTLTKDDFRKAIWYMQNSKHPITRLFQTPIDTLIVNFMHDWVYNWVGKIVNFE